MPVRFVIGRAGSGKTDRCFRSIIDQMRQAPLGPPLYWILPRQATFTAERQLTCASGLAGFCRARAVSFEQLGQDIVNDCGGSAVPEVTPLGRQMILARLLRRHERELVYFSSVARQVGLAGELDCAFAELERAGKSAEDLGLLIEALERAGPLDVEQSSLAAKLRDVRLLYDAYGKFLGQERLDQHRRLMQVLSSVRKCSLFPRARVWVDAFVEFSEFERRLLSAIAAGGAQMEITLLMDPDSPVLTDPHRLPDEMSLFHRTETTYRKLWFAMSQEGVEIQEPIRLRQTPRFRSAELARIEREFERETEHESENGKSDKSTSIHRILAPDRTAEVDAVAREIRALLRQSYRLRDIAVLVRDLDDYHAQISASFEEHNIPYFVDRRRTATHHPLLEFLRASFHIAMHFWPHDWVIALLKSGFAGLSLDQADELENYVLVQRISGPAWEATAPWAAQRRLTRGENQPDDSIDVQRIDAQRRSVVDKLLPFVRKLRDGPSRAVRDIAAAVFDLFEAFNVRATLQNWMDEALTDPTDGTASSLEERAEHQEVWSEIVRQFDQMVELLGDEWVTPAEFLEILESGLERFDLALTPPTVDQVLIGQIDRTICPPVRAAFVMGLNEGQFPRASGRRTILTDRERQELSRRRLELDCDSRRSLLDESLLGYLALTRASEQLILTRAACDESLQEARESEFWRRIERIVPGAPITVLPPAREGDLEQISTARQLVMSVMQWARERVPLAACAQGERVRVRGEEPPAQLDAGPLTPALSPEYRGEGEERDPARPRLFRNEQEASANPWPALYHWLANYQSRDDAIGRVRHRAWPALSYRNEAVLLGDAKHRLFPAPLKATVPQLETFAACQFKHFVSHGLQLQRRPDQDITIADLGRIYHLILERLMRRVIELKEKSGDPLPISQQMIRDAAQQVGNLLRDELMLGSARNQYLLARVERTLAQLVESQRELLKRWRFRPSHTGVKFADDATIPPLRLTTPGGAEINVEGKIDRIDSLPDSSDVVAIDYRLTAKPLVPQQAYHGLSLGLLTCLQALQDNGAMLAGRALAPAAAFYVQLLRFHRDVDHPDEAPDVSDPEFLLALKPRGIFEDRIIHDLDGELSEGRSLVVNAFITKQGGFGHRNASDVATSDELAALLDWTRRRIGQIADEILAGTIAIRPYRLARQSPCPRCEFHSVCRFDPFVNGYRPLTSMNRDQVFTALQEANGGR